MSSLLSALVVAAPLAAAPTLPAPVRAVAEPQHVTLKASAGRNVDVSLWPVRHPRGVIIFHHGYGGDPLAYRQLLTRFAGAGYAIVAPRSLDSHAGPLKGEVSPQQAFTTRVEDLALTRTFAAQRFPGQRVVLVGHSFGSLIALIGAGAATPAGPAAGPPVAGLIAFSTPGSVPGLVGPDAFRTLRVPLLLVTGDADVVPGFVTDWHDHRRAFDEAPVGGRTMIVVRGGEHDLVVATKSPAVPAVEQAAIDFLDSVTMRSPAARRRFAGLRSNAAYRIERR